MGNTRARRRIASAVVLSAVVGSAGYAAMITVTESSPTTHPMPPNTNGRVVFSIRNDATTPLTIGTIGVSAVASVDCVKFGPITPLGASMPAPVTIAAGDQAQFESKLLSPAAGSASCTFDIHDSSLAMIGSVTLTSIVGGDETDLQPRLMQLKPRKGSAYEEQRVLLQNYTGGTLAPSNYGLQIIGANASWLAFSDPNCMSATPQQCKPTSSLADGSGALFNVRCTPMAMGSAAGQIVAFQNGSAMMIGSASFTCFAPPTPPQIMVANPGKLVSIYTPPLVEGSGSAMVISSMGSGAPEVLVSATLTGPAGIYFKGCTSATSCMFAPAKMLPFALPVYCTPPDVGMLSATLQVNGLASSDTASVSCFGASTAPWIRVTPAMLDAPDTVVGQTSNAGNITIENLGDTALTNVVITADASWSVNACTMAMPCTIVKGTPKIVAVTFAPQAFGPITTDASVTSNDTVHGTQFVQLNGLGVGSRLVQVTPPPGDMISIGPIGRNQLVTRDITVRDDGNRNIDIAAALTGDAPLSITPAQQNGVGSGAETTFTVRCQSATAGTFTGSATISSTQVYEGSPIDIGVSCDVAMTSLQVNPTQFDFGEVRVGAPEKMIEVDLTNPGPDPTLNVTAVALSGSRPGLSLDNGFLGQSHPLGSGATLMEKPIVKLVPMKETDLTGTSFNVTVDGDTLTFPILGKVVKPASYVTPTRLDLGTICVGSTTSGLEMLVNSGTATLQVKAPTMTPSQQFTTQSSLPAALAAGDHADVEVKPDTSKAGDLHSVLTIEDDVPSKYDVDVDVSIIDTGTALSPRALSFGTIHAGNTSPELTITLENCGLEPAPITIAKVSAQHGASSAWQVSPPPGFSRTLGTHERQTIAVAFSPKSVGDYAAQLGVDVSGERQIVMLVGHGGGDQDKTTSFYACANCSTGSPLGLVPLTGVVLVIILRRRRGSS
jgi:hypothetical protein